MQIHYNYIDRLKGISILFVVMMHLTNWTFQQSENEISFVFGAFTMPLFFFLSGLVITSIPDRNKLCTKFQRFLSPFIFVGLAFALFPQGIEGLGIFFTTSNKTGYWYLFVLAIFYCQLAFLRFNDTDRSAKGICLDIGSLIGLTAFFYFCEYTLPLEITELLSLDKIRTQWPFFFFGYLVHKYNMIRWFENDVVFTIALISIIPLYFLQRINPHTFILISLSIIISLVVLFRRRNNAHTVVENELVRLGKGSLDIYIYHYFFIRPIGGYRMTELGEWLQRTDNWILEFFILVIIAVVTSYCCLLIGHVLRQSRILTFIIYGMRLERYDK